MTQKLSKKEQLVHVAMAASLKVEWVGENQQQARLPAYDGKDWDPFEDTDDAKELARYMGYTIEVNKRLNRTIVSNGMREVAMSHGRDGENVERATRRAITQLAALFRLGYLEGVTWRRMIF